MDSQTRNEIYRGQAQDGLYSVPISILPQLLPKAFVASLDTWHQRLGHANLSAVKKALSNHSINFSSSKHALCHGCSVSKIHKLPFSLSRFRATHPLELICSDLWGPAPISSYDDQRYYVLFYDHYSKFSWIYFLRYKSQLMSVFIQFRQLVEKHFDRPIKIFQSDWGGEFQRLTSYLAAHGIVHRSSCPYTPEQNGCAERKHRHIVDNGLALMHTAKIPLKYWTLAFDTSTYLINRTPTPLLSYYSPYSVLFQSHPNINDLRIFGCLCYPWLRPHTNNKLEPRSVPCVFMGYSRLHKGYRCLHIPTGRIYVSRHVLFDETIFPFTGQMILSPSTAAADATSAPTPLPTPHRPTPHRPTPQITLQNPPPPTFPNDPPLGPSSPTSPNTPTLGPPTTPPTLSPEHSFTSLLPSSPPTSPTPPSATIPPPPSTTIPPPTSSLNTHPMITRSRTGSLKPRTFLASTTLPSTVCQALSRPAWRAAMSEELNALLRNHTWDLVLPPPTANVISNKWVFRVKEKADGSIERFKARLVARGFQQVEGVDYNDTFSPVLKPATLRLILSLAVTHSWPLHQIDISNAFLHGSITEELYMTQPQGFVDPDKPNHVCRLRKSLYGLKQAPRAWYACLATALEEFGFMASKTDTSLFIYTGAGVCLYLLVYIDDIIITGSSTSHLQKLFLYLRTKFALRDLGKLSYFLGVEVTTRPEGLYLSQQKYIRDLLHKANMTEAHSITTPCTLDLIHKAGTTVSPPFEDPSLYRHIVGSLQYLNFTRPDLAFAINHVSQYMHAPLDDHWLAVKRILRYLKGTIEYGLLITKSASHSLQGYSDASWASSPRDRKSITGYAVYHGPNLISWSTRKQRSVARSSTESEYRALATVAAEVVWLQSLLVELRQPLSHAPTLWCDNLGATYLSHNPVFHSRSKHMEIEFHFVRDRVARKQLQVKYIPAQDQLADVLTKPLTRPQLQHFCTKLHVSPVQLAGA
ncbi:Retrovirus-related Pol polyprotein from transposon RE2 [Linum perenne]